MNRRAFLGATSAFAAVGIVAQPPTFGPFPSTAELGRIVTGLDHGLLRSAFTGQANAILLGPSLRLLESRHLILNPFRFRRRRPAASGSVSSRGSPGGRNAVFYRPCVFARATRRS